ncbi:hypothetical protein [Vibrio rarus]|uniref:hypothetical protein n=1 Tax=Vibrio rarus TaxID=413403 RepID=UPI0021C3BC77|nr:hypothetical protein [Vibrio rarus]
MSMHNELSLKKEFKKNWGSLLVLIFVIAAFGYLFIELHNAISAIREMDQLIDAAPQTLPIGG